MTQILIFLSALAVAKCKLRAAGLQVTPNKKFSGINNLELPKTQLRCPKKLPTSSRVSVVYAFTEPSSDALNKIFESGEKQIFLT